MPQVIKIRKVKLSIIAFLAVVLSTITTVYAWIALANVNKIENISLNAIANYELLMSLDGKDYYTEIPEHLIFEKFRNLQFDDVTSLDGKTFYKHFDINEKAKPNKDYISLTIYFQTTSEFTEIFLVDNRTDVNYDSPPTEGTYITSKGVTFKTNTTFLYDVTETNDNVYFMTGQTKTFYAKDAMRISFYQEDEASKIFDLSENEHRGFGKLYGAHDHYLKTQGIAIPIPESKPITLYDLPSIDDDDPRLNEQYLLLTLEKTNKTTINNKPIYEGKVTMNIWLEGYDADAFDGIFGDQLKLQFMFKAMRPNKYRQNKGE